MATTLLAELCADLGAAGPAPGLVRALTPFDSRVAVLGHGIAAIGAVGGPLGRLEAQLGHWEAAERHLRDAIALNERLGALPALARAKAGYAAMLTYRDGAAAGPALQLRDEARALAATIGLVALEPAPAPHENHKTSAAS